MLGLTRTGSSARLSVETLEERTLLSAGLLSATSGLLNGVLSTVGSTLAAVHVTVPDSAVHVAVSAHDVSAGSTLSLGGQRGLGLDAHANLPSPIEQPIVSTTITTGTDGGGQLPVGGKVDITGSGTSVQVQGSTGSGSGRPVVSVDTGGTTSSGGTGGVPLSGSSASGGSSAGQPVLTAAGGAASAPATGAPVAPPAGLAGATATSGGGGNAALGPGAAVPAGAAITAPLPAGSTAEDSGAAVTDPDADLEPADLLTEAAPPGPAFVQAVFQDAVGRVDRLGAQVTDSLLEARLAPWLLAGAAAVVAAEVARRRLRRVALAVVPAGDALFPGEEP